MNWWTVELTEFVVLVGVAVGVQQVIRRYGVTYAKEAFRETPRAASAFLALADIAYYLIAFSYALFNVDLQPEVETTTAEHLEHAIHTVGGLALTVGILHAINVLLLPGIGNLLAGRTRSRRFPRDEESEAPA